jgi:hypothetical protein
MKIELKEVAIRDLVKAYTDNAEEGIFGYDSKLNIRPPYQREFIYKDKQRDAVINTVRKDFPLNVMYWAKNGEDSYELLDGQQRTISICQYVTGQFSINYQYFHNLEPEEKEQILNYKLTVYVCEGDNREKLDWFRTINIAGEKLTDQELLNAVYHGEWLTDAKRHFSKTNCAAWNMAKDYISGSPIRQDFLETAIRWISKDNIEEYMSKHQHTPNASELWLYFQAVINWVKTNFINYRKEMKSVEWGILYNQVKDTFLDAKGLETSISVLMQDEDVTKKAGIYPYLLTKDEKYLSIRSFTDKNKREAYELQKGICSKCEKHFELDEMEADHITPWSQGGRTVLENCKMLCKHCNRLKSDK